MPRLKYFNTLVGSYTGIPPYYYPHRCPEIFYNKSCKREDMREFGVVSDFAFPLITCVSQTELLAKLITAKHNMVRLK